MMYSRRMLDLGIYLAVVLIEVMTVSVMVELCQI